MGTWCLSSFCKKNRTNPKGSALVELAFLIPILLLVLLIALELTNIMSIQQRLGMISKEATNIVARDCITLDPYCMNDIVKQTSIVLPGAEIIISIYSTGTGGVTQTGSYSTSSQVSRYNPTNVASNITSLDVGLNPTVIISEAFHKHTPWLGIPMANSILYEATIF